MFLFSGAASPGVKLPAAPRASARAGAEAQLPDAAPAASARSREQKRFDRYDKDRDETVSREEYLASRRKAFARLDTDGDGKLGFEEWAAKTTGKFAGADKDKSGTLTRAEFAATAPTPRRTPARCSCATPTTAVAPKDDDES